VAESGPRVDFLWPEGAPGALGDRDIDKPTLAVYLPQAHKATGVGLVVCPGGDYWEINLEREGHEVARWLAEVGIAAFVLRYRLAPSYHHPSQLQDGRRAIRVVRARAAEWGVDPARVGIMGFSAGGHLAGAVATHFSDGNPQAEDPIARVSSRPDFMVLAYPVVSLNSRYTHAPSREHLLGDQKPSERKLDSLSNEKQVTTGTPPTFIVHAGDDKVVPPENSVLLYIALRRVGVGAEMHLYERGGHGFGLGLGHPVVGDWTERWLAWMRARGLLD